MPPKVRGAQGAQCHLQSQGRSAAYYLYLGGYVRTEGMIGERLSAPIPCRFLPRLADFLFCRRAHSGLRRFECWQYSQVRESATRFAVPVKRRFYGSQNRSNRAAPPCYSPVSRGIVPPKPPVGTHCFPTVLSDSPVSPPESISPFTPN